MFMLFSFIKCKESNKTKKKYSVQFKHFNPSLLRGNLICLLEEQIEIQIITFIKILPRRSCLTAVVFIQFYYIEKSSMDVLSKE